MAQVMYDKAIMFEGQIYAVTQTWNGPQIVLATEPDSDRLRTLITHIIKTQGQLTLKCCPSYYEILVPGS